MTNFLLIHLYNDYSGSPRVLKTLSNVISSLNIPNKISLLTSNSTGVLDELDCEQRLSFTYYPRDNYFLKFIFYIFAQLSIFKITSSFLFANRRCNNILVINTMLPFGAAFAKLFFPSTKVVYYLHETYIKPPFLKWMLLRVIKLFSDKNIYVSSYVRSELKFEKEPGEVIFNSVDNDLIGNAVLDRKEDIVLFLSSLVHYKGVDKFIELARLSEKNDKAVYGFIMILNCNLDEFNDFISLNNIVLPKNLNVVFRPSNIVQYYLKSKFVINLTDHNYCIETFGLTLVEGLCNGAIPIAPNYGGPKEILVNRNCMLYDDIDLDAILEFIICSKFDGCVMNNLIESSKKFLYENYKVKITSFFGELYHRKFGE